MFEPGFFLCPFIPNGPDLRPQMIADDLIKSREYGWCLKLREEILKESWNYDNIS